MCFDIGKSEFGRERRQIDLRTSEGLEKLSKSLQRHIRSMFQLFPDREVLHRKFWFF
jgi:hypothetical protein